MLGVLLTLFLNGEPMNRVAPVTGTGTAPVLYELPLASSRFGLPDEYGKALALFDEAKREYESGKAAKAAKKFIDVADLLKAPKQETTYSGSFAKMRAIAYQDAAIAYGEAGEAAERKKALSAALKKDPENQATLKALIDKK